MNSPDSLTITSAGCVPPCSVPAVVVSSVKSLDRTTDAGEPPVAALKAGNVSENLKNPVPV